MLIKLIAADSNHYNIQVQNHALSRLSNIIVLDNKKLSINEVLEILTGVGNFTSTDM